MQQRQFPMKHSLLFGKRGTEEKAEGTKEIPHLSDDNSAKKRGKEGEKLLADQDLHPSTEASEQSALLLLLSVVNESGDMPVKRQYTCRGIKGTDVKLFSLHR